MIISAEVLDAMVASGCTAEQIVSVVKAACVTDEEAAERRRTKARDLKRAQRAAAKAALELSSGQRRTSQDIAGRPRTSEDSEDIGSLSPAPLLPPTPPNNPLTPKPSSKSNSRAIRLPEDWVLTGPNLAYALSKGFAEPQIVSMHEAFCAWAWSASGKNALKRNWNQAWHGWVLREKPSGGNARAGPARAPTTFQQRRQETREILDELDDFATGRGSGDEAHSGFLSGDPGERPKELRGGIGGVVIDLPVCGSRAGS